MDSSHTTVNIYSIDICIIVQQNMICTMIITHPTEFVNNSYRQCVTNTNDIVNRSRYLTMQN